MRRKKAWYLQFCYVGLKNKILFSVIYNKGVYCVHCIMPNVCSNLTCIDFAFN